VREGNGETTNDLGGFVNDPAKALIAISFFASVTYIARGIFQVCTKWIESKRDPLPASNIEERLARIEQAVEAIAIEVERGAEAQRFSAQLLAERGQASLPPRGRDARTVTPH
jgi:hypothetical protein